MQLHLNIHLGPIPQVMKYSFITPLSELLLKDLNKPILHVLFTSEAYHTDFPTFGTLT
jgi:hypothetical protein